MKKLILILVLIISFTSQAQKKANWGIKAGVNYSTIMTSSSSEEDRYEFNPKTGLYLGAFLNIQYSKLYAFQPEVVYSNQGGVAKFSENEDENIHYISLAANNKFFIMKDERFHLLVGLSADFNLNDNIIEENISDGVSPIDIAFFAGLGYQFDFGLTLEARYKKGNISVFSNEAWTDIAENEGSKNSLFQFGVAYKFDLKKESEKIVK